jgi:hypothetical protein
MQRTLFRFARAVNGILMLAVIEPTQKKPRLFKGAASQQGGSHHRADPQDRSGAIRLAEAG